MAFDPDAYLASSTAAPKAVGGFDPDAYLSGKPTANEGIPGERTLGGFAGNVIKSGGKMLTGIYEAVTHPLDTATAIADIGAGALQKALPQGVVDFINKFDNNPEAAQRAVKVAEAVGGEYKNRYGSIEALKNTLYTDPVGAAGDISMLLSGGGTALTKAGQASKAAQVVRAGEVVNKLADVTNPLNALPLQTAGKVIGKAADVGINALNPKNATLLKAAEGRAPEIINELRNTPRTFTEGYQPTAGEAITGLNVTRMPALYKELAAVDTATTPVYQRGLQQAEALAAPLAVAESIPTAVAKRAETAENLYGLADKAVIAADDTLVSLMTRPSMDKVMERARVLSEEKGQPFQIGETKTRFDTLTNQPIVYEQAKFPGTSLHNIKQAFDQMISDPATYGIGKSEANAIKSTRGQFLKWAEDQAPAYKAARETFAAESKPISQMEVADYLKGKLTSAQKEGTLTPASFSAAMENAPSTLKKATGEPRFKDLNEVLDPEQIAVLEQIRSDLSNKAKFEEQAKAGAKGGRQVPEGAALPRAPHVFSKVVSLANDVLSRLQGKITRKIAIDLATTILDPQAAAMSLEKAYEWSQRNQRGAKMAKEVGSEMKKGLRSKAALSATQVNNALSSQQNQNALVQ